MLAKLSATCGASSSLRIWHESEPRPSRSHYAFPATGVECNCVFFELFDASQPKDRAHGQPNPHNRISLLQQFAGAGLKRARCRLQSGNNVYSVAKTVCRKAVGLRLLEKLGVNAIQYTSSRTSSTSQLHRHTLSHTAIHQSRRR